MLCSQTIFLVQKIKVRSKMNEAKKEIKRPPGWTLQDYENFRIASIRIFEILRKNAAKRKDRKTK